MYLPARLSGADRDYFLGTLHWSPVQSPQFVTDPEYECGSVSDSCLSSEF